MLHHIQLSIINRLSTKESSSFSQLKPDDVDNKLFTYHLKQVLRENLVIKNGHGSYQLSQAGKRLWKRIREKPETVADRAFSVIFLIVRRKSDSAWLLYKRNTHPLINRIGFIHCTPRVDKDIISTAQSHMADDLGIICKFKFVGSGYFRIFRGNSLESFTHFSLLESDDAEGEISATTPEANYFWDKSPDFNAPSMLPNMPILVSSYRSSDRPFFIDDTLYIDEPPTT